MKRRSIDLTVFGYIFLIGFGIALYNTFQSLNNPFLMAYAVYFTEYQGHLMSLLLLYLLQVIGFIGLLEGDNKARRFLIGINFVSCLYYASLGMATAHRLYSYEMLALLNIIIMYYISRPYIRDQFEAVRTLNKQKVLVIDDDRGLVQTLRNTLRSEGYDIYVSFTGEQGLEMAQQIKPDLIILDVILPRMKGREVCEQLKADPLTQNIPVLFLTAKDSEDDIKAEMEAGGAGHLTKPVDAQTLLNEINKIFNSK